MNAEKSIDVFHIDFAPYQERLTRIAKSFPAASRHLLFDYLDQRVFPLARKSTASHGRSMQPYWMYLPFWILHTDMEDRNQEQQTRELVPDLVWAQLCLFLVFRLQDDVFDGTAERASLIFPANLFFSEAVRVLGVHFPFAHPFWRLFHRTVRHSSDAMIATRRIEETFDASATAHARGLKAINSVLLLSAFAASLSAGAVPPLGSIRAFGDALGIAGQLLDDLHDVNEDLDQGRINHAARLILHNAGAHSFEEIRSIIEESGYEPVAERISRLYRTAERAANTFPGDCPRRYVRYCATWMEQTVRNHGLIGLTRVSPETPPAWEF